MLTINLFLSYLILSNMILFDFNKDSDLSNWKIVDDVVMGGRSDGHFGINEEGHAVFKGRVSLENNGGFSSVRYFFDKTQIDSYSKINIRLKGDGKQFQFRVKSNKYDRHSYIYYFETSGDWQTVSVPMAEMAPEFRGGKLDIPNYTGKVLEEVAILISNKKSETFSLEIDKITLE